MMDSLLPTLGLAIAAALLYGLLRKSAPAFALLLRHPCRADGPGKPGGGHCIYKPAALRRCSAAD